MTDASSINYNCKMFIIQATLKRHFENSADFLTLDTGNLAGVAPIDTKNVLLRNIVNTSTPIDI
jgi:hypothetical protein